MNIININSDIEINYTQKAFIEEVLFSSDDHHGIEKDSFFGLSKTVPIFLINEKSMQKHEQEIESEYRYELNPETKPHTEWLGFYGRDSAGLFEHTPRIAICPERIAQCVNTDEEFIFLFAKVIIHEFAHAKMDTKDQNVKYRTKDTFWKWMEESSANRYTLEVFETFTQNYRCKKSSFFRNKSWGNTLFDFVVDFIKRQPPEYALGYELFSKRPVQSWEWEREKDTLCGSKRKLEKNEWLTYMQQNYKNIDEKEATLLFDAVFNGKKISIENLAKQKLEDKINKNDPNITQEDIENVTDMSSLFHGVKELKADISKWDVSHVTNMAHMFKFSTFNPDISKWNVSNVIDMSFMFCDAEFDRDISNWNLKSLKKYDEIGIENFDLDRHQKLKRIGKFRSLLR